MVRSFLGKGLLISVLTLLVASCNEGVTVTSDPEAAPGATATGTTITGTIVVADISDEPAQKIEEYQPFIDYLATQLDDVGINSGQVEVAPDMATMADWLASGKVDIYFDSPYPSLIVGELSGAQPVLRRWKDGVAAYRTVIFVQADSEFATINDLKGQMVAFEDPFSTSGYMLPLAYLIEVGMTLVEKPDVDAQLAADQVGYVFSDAHENSIQWVLSGKVAAAAVAYPDFLEIPADIRQKLTILAETEPLPRHLVMLSPTLSSEEAAAIRSALLTMDESDTGRAVLVAFERTTQFDEFPEGAEQALSRMRALYSLTQNQGAGAATDGED
ncbi:MAG: phosphate/phosphite/phosphonate ABC transporter substrate-binding protein [Cyanobacteria bacterium]|nr:phosphate/phosphite/phosphonate ABC transporter substrate-binding protein [Cyanobacteriota bacterium]MDA0867151.1 phosphate/phosphite/phosphonate ABC transporter substrate-binding protein [Cyanobacteriota bacterium]